MFARLAVAMFVTALVLVGCGSVAVPTDRNGATPSPTAGVSDQGFPVEVLGMPVLSVGGLNQLIASGKLDGRVAAVGGWWLASMMLSCPAPFRTMTPLESYCEQPVFASQPFATYSCSRTPEMTSCSGNGTPRGTDTVSPVIVAETGAGQTAWSANWNGESGNVGTPMVLVGHARDPRFLLCPLDVREVCAQRFVVDRIVWSDGQDVALSADNQMATHLTIDEATALVTDAAIAAAPFHQDESILDPRLHAAGSGIDWLIRTVGAAGADAQDPTRAAAITVIDDATGNVLSTLPLVLGPDSQLGTVSVQATLVGECCVANVYPFYAIEKEGLPVGGGGQIGFPVGSDQNTRFGPEVPAVLDAGDYTVHVWRSTRLDNGLSGPAQDDCRTDITLAPGQDLRFEAAFAMSGPCTFVDPTFVNPFS